MSLGLHGHPQICQGREWVDILGPLALLRSLAISADPQRPLHSGLQLAHQHEKRSTGA